MPKYRIYFAERERVGDDRSPYVRIYGSSDDPRAYKETEWEEEVEAGNAREALSRFFVERVPDRSQVRVLERKTETRDLRGFEDYEPGNGYVWLEGDKMMEYRGMDEPADGMVTCPLCAGKGEVDEGIAEEFLAEYEVTAEEEGDQ